MARYECTRCKAVLNTTMPAHLCKDVEQRLDEATRRASVGCRGTGRGEGWAARMDHYDPVGKRGPRAYGHDWAIDHHGTWMDLCHPRTSASHR